MDPERQPVLPGVETWRSMVALSVIVAIALLLYWSVRDGGPSPGAIVGSVVVGVLLFAVLAMIRRVRNP